MEMACGICEYKVARFDITRPSGGNLVGPPFHWPLEAKHGEPNLSTTTKNYY
jgi:hypothetical protein